MDNKTIQFKNEFEQPISNKDIKHFNTLQSFSNQSTSLLEVTLSDTLGLSMHNAVSNQQQSQMTTAASVTNACARLLQAKEKTKPSNDASLKTEKKEQALTVTRDEQLGRDRKAKTPVEEKPKQKKRFSLMRFLKRDNGESDE